MAAVARMAAFFLLLGCGMAQADTASRAESCRTVYVADHGWHTGLIVPAMTSFVASDTLRIGIIAVCVFNSIPGSNPNTTGKITTRLNGVRVLCASLNDLA